MLVLRNGTILYKDMWMRQSKMLAPLTNLVGECVQTKTTKANGTKKASWRCDEIHQQAFDLIKTTIARNVVVAYPDYSERLRYMLTPLNPKLAQSLLRETDH